MWFNVCEDVSAAPTGLDDVLYIKSCQTKTWKSVLTTENPLKKNKKNIDSKTKSEQMLTFYPRL